LEDEEEKNEIEWFLRGKIKMGMINWREDGEDRERSKEIKGYWRGHEG
jgi:hypothetical protein